MHPILSHIPIFDGISPEALTELGLSATKRVFRAGSVLMRQGEESDCLHVIVSGAVRVEREHPSLQAPVVLAELGPGEIVGEMGVLDREPRSATVTAIQDTETLELGETALSLLLVRHSAGTAHLLRILTRRLRSTDELIELMLRRGREKAVAAK